MANILALGELLIDFIQIGISDSGNPIYEANPGGAPCNFLSMTSKLGHKAYFIGKVGNDNFGLQLEKTVKEAKVNTEGLIKSYDYGTTLAFVHHDNTGDRSFTFYRAADAQISEYDIKEELFKAKDVFHLGTLSMTNEICKKASLKAIKIAKEKNLLISFDPNLRENLWTDLEKAREAFIEGLKVCNILKIADNEIKWFTQKDNLEEAIKVLREQYPIDLIFLTLGRDGSIAYYNNISVSAPTFLNIKCVDTTGAGDSFMGCAISKVLEIGLSNLNENNLKEILLFANAGASLVASKRGVIKVLPSINEINLLKNSK